MDLLFLLDYWKVYNAVTSVSVTCSVKKTLVRTLSWIQLVWLSYGRQIACEAEESQEKTNTEFE